MSLKRDALKIRRYEPGDEVAISRLHDVAMREAGIHLGEGVWYDDLQRIQEVYLRDGGEFLVGTVNREIVAMGAVKKTDEDRAEIKYMRVNPELQQRGFGGIMLAALERRAADLGYATLHLDTAAKQKAARRLYESNGYRETHRDKRGPLDCVLYEKGNLARGTT